jgi:hypothetical protein
LAIAWRAIPVLKLPSAAGWARRDGCMLSRGALTRRIPASIARSDSGKKPDRSRVLDSALAPVLKSEVWG